MSYIRGGHPLMYFEGESESYVFTDGKDVVDYGDKYEDNATFAELIVKIILRETKDEAYAWKIAGVLEKKLNIKRRRHKLSAKEFFKLCWKKVS